MGATAGLMLGSLAMGDAQASGQRAAGAYTERMSELNAQRAEMEAENALKRGDKEAQAYGKKVSQMAGSQRASLAAQGIAVDKGNAGDLISQTYQMGAEDVQTIRNNAFREAMGFKSQAFQTRSEGAIANAGAQAQATYTMLGAGMSAVRYAQEGGYFKAFDKKK